MFFCIHNGEGAAEIHTVLMISTQYSQIQYLRGILQKYPDKFQLGGTADNSVLGMSLIESTQPDLVIMPAYMNFWNAEDLINYLLPRGICPTFLLLNDEPGLSLGAPVNSRVAAVFPTELPPEEDLLQALCAAAEQHGRKKREPPAREQHDQAVQHSLEVMELLMGLIPPRTGEAQVEFGRLRVGRSDCWQLLGSPKPRNDEPFNFFSQIDSLEAVLHDLFAVLEPVGKCELCVYRESNLCILLAEGQDEPDWERLIGKINLALAPYSIPPLAFEISDVPLPIERWHSQCKDLLQLRHKRFFFSPPFLQPKTVRAYQSTATQGQVRDLLSVLSLALQNLARPQLVSSLGSLEALVCHDMSTDLYSFVTTQLSVQYSRLRYNFGLTGSDDEFALRIRQFSSAHEAFEAFRELFLKLYDQLCNENRSSNQLIIEVTSFINQNLGEEISLERAAGHVHINATYLSRLFKRETGSSFSAYVNERRIQRAMQLLETPYKIIDIAGMVGFDNAKYFSQVFKKQVGKTPQQYRTELRKAGGI